MAHRPIRTALVAVYDKQEVVPFARTLVDEFGIELISTGGTARHLEDAGLPVTRVEQVTGFPEMLDGRVKTLHPKIHAGILADRDNTSHLQQLAAHDIKPIDMVVVNLYPFEQTIARDDCAFDQAIEMIDIGGPCMLRAAAKNHRHVLVVSKPAAYDFAIEALRSWDDAAAREHALRLGAESAFFDTATYDSHIVAWLSRNDSDGHARHRFLPLSSLRSLRYGENPHQKAELLSQRRDDDDMTTAEVTNESKVAMSFNNWQDADAAAALCNELAYAGDRFAATFPATPTTTRKNTCSAVFIKHTNACGVGISAEPINAYRDAYLGDPNAAMGGILAVDFPVNADFADAVMHSLDRWGKEAGAGAFFVEVLLAPSFEDNAIEVIRSTKKWGERVRLLCAIKPESAVAAGTKLTSLGGGYLSQDRDILGLNEADWRVASERRPSSSEWADLRLAWLVCKHTKSNAITICKDGMLIGNGAGQMSRVMSCRVASWLAEENGHADRLQGAAAASDAFFPFRDGPDMLAASGVTAIIQPGGSKRDEETIAACNEYGIAMVLTGTRHFKH